MNEYIGSIDVLQKKSFEEECILVDSEDNVIGKDTKLNCILHFIE